VGKSLYAARLYVELNLRGVHTELVGEYAKELLYQNLLHRTPQRKILREQIKRQQMLQGVVRIAVTDSAPQVPLLYAPDHQVPSLEKLMKELTASWTSLTLLAHRDLSLGYQAEGRTQTASESQRFHDEKVVPFVRSRVEPAHLLEVDVCAPLDPVVERILQMERSLGLPAPV
ncbi:hypothetical protein LC612_36305, partial [Nostoc sp. CHAB 5834]|nr:hypothetical protein [Nostoc sp. CHAB 5834]